MNSRKIIKILVGFGFVITMVCSTASTSAQSIRGTYGLFTSNANYDVEKIRTAKEDDIIEYNIKNLRFDYSISSFMYNNMSSGYFIELKSKSAMKDLSRFYFQVNGRIKPFIININPITMNTKATELSNVNFNTAKLRIDNKNCVLSSNSEYFISEDGCYYIPIYFKTNFVDINDFNDLFLGVDGYLNGKISINYLNKYIVDEKEIYVEKSYLENVGFRGNYRIWNDIIKNMNGSVTGDSSGSLVDNVNDSYYKFNSGTKTLTNQQIKIINIIANGYMEYVESLKSNGLVLQNMNKELLLENENLKQQINIIKNKK